MVNDLAAENNSQFAALLGKSVWNAGIWKAFAAVKLVGVVGFLTHSTPCRMDEKTLLYVADSRFWATPICKDSSPGYPLLIVVFSGLLEK
jgi:hypothetical protein